ncbi:uncharacterized protein C8R40DRAFT_1070885 [Lentinula edodes]|uniref:uncharacterized protein n=1 Tax=Lentinula edodes TaxID=5353 RepID=UPI001E8EC883|nr:uncharacterized protein C8R40DRAFT_1070885 [Lentinula edodes]KAH7873688.1 hypothetical protein C8R40DRAFT_1070885 [Lentinula edodes]
MVLRGRLPITTDLDSAPLVSSSAISDTTSSSMNAVFNDNASSCASTIPAPTKLLVDIQEYPAIPSSWEEYLKRQGGNDKLVEGLESVHATSEHIFKAQKEEIQLRRHQISVLKEQRRKYQETLCMTKLTQERELCCSGCGNLAWDPQVCVSSCFVVVLTNILSLEQYVDTRSVLDALIMSDKQLVFLVERGGARSAELISTDLPSHR